MADGLQELWQAQRGSAVLWSPVVLSFGIWAYFALPREPAFALTAAFMLLAGVFFWMAPARTGFLLMAVFLSGFVLANIRAEIVATPLLKATTGEVIVSGTVREVEHASAKRRTIILQPQEIEGSQYRFHVTLAYGLSSVDFAELRKSFSRRHVQLDFQANHIDLLCHTGRQWVTYQRTRFQKARLPVS